MRLFRPQIISRILVVLILFAISCNGGTSCGGATGCDGCGDGTYEFPVNDPSRPDAIIQNETVRVRITQHLLDFLRPQLPNVVRSMLDGQSGMYVDADGVLHIDIPNTDLFDIGVAEAKVRDAEALLWLDELENNLQLSFEEPNGVRLTMNNLRLGINLKLKEDIIGTDSSCPVFGDLGPLGPGPLKHAAVISVNGLIEPGVGAAPDYNLEITTNVDDVEINDLDIEVAGSSVYCNESECRDCLLEVAGTCLDPGGRCAECHVFCGGITNALFELVVALVDLLEPLLNNIIPPLVENLLGSALNDLNGSSAKIETQIDLADLSGMEALRNANPMGILVAPQPGSFPVLDRGTGLGMELIVDGGAEGELADCIGELEDFVPLKGPVPEMLGTDSRNRPYHLGLTFASAYINQVLYALHRSGSLCIKMGSKDVQELTDGQFTLNASLLGLLASDISKLATDRAPVILELKPREPGRVDLGTAEIIGQDPNTGEDIYDWLLQVSLEDLGIAFHVLMHDRYVRVFEVTSNIFVGVNITVLPDNKLEIAVGELRIDDFEETFNEILPNADFAAVLPTLIDLVMGAVLNQALTFDVDITTAISDALNGAPIYMRVNDIFRDGIQEDYLTLTITLTSSQTGNLMLAAETHARLHPTEPGLLARKTDGRMMPTGQIRLEVGQASEHETKEYQLRVDGSLWRAPQRPNASGTILVDAPYLFVPGLHEVEVRARYVGDYRSMDPTPTLFEVMVDPYRPSLTAQLDGDEIEIQVLDSETRDGELITIFARDLEDWYELAELTANEGQVTYRIPAADAESITFKARDPSNNESKIAKVHLGIAAEETFEPETSGCACSASNKRSLIPFALLLLGVFLRRLSL